MTRVAVRVSIAGRGAAPEGWTVLRPGACPCCVGRVQLQVDLARLLRSERPKGVVIEIADPTHAVGVARALGEAPLSDSVCVES